jgi:hypothetical protein
MHAFQTVKLWVEVGCSSGTHQAVFPPAVLPSCQALLVLVKRSPPDGRKLLVIGTSSRSK